MKMAHVHSVYFSSWIGIHFMGSKCTTIFCWLNKWKKHISRLQIDAMIFIFLQFVSTTCEKDKKSISQMKSVRCQSTCFRVPVSYSGKLIRLSTCVIYLSRNVSMCDHLYTKINQSVLIIIKQDVTFYIIFAGNCNRPENEKKNAQFISWWSNCWSIPIQFHERKLEYLVIERINNPLFLLQLYFYLFHWHKWELTGEWIHVEDTVQCGCMKHCAKQRQVRQSIHFIQGQTGHLSAWKQSLVCKRSVFGLSSRWFTDKNTELSLHAMSIVWIHVLIPVRHLYRSVQQKPTSPDLNWVNRIRWGNR